MNGKNGFSIKKVVAAFLLSCLLTGLLYKGTIANSGYYNAKKVIDFEEYDKDISEIELQHDLATMAAKLDLFVRSIKEKDNGNIFTKEEFEQLSMYADFVIYGDDVYHNANVTEGKILYLNNIIGSINYHIDDVNEFVSSLSKEDKKSYSDLWKNLNKNIESTNNTIVEYNKINDTKNYMVYLLKDIGK